MRDVRRSYVRDQYPAVVRNNRLRTSDVRRLRDEASGFGYTPVVSIFMPVLRPERGALEKALESVLDQAYPGWELCVCASVATRDHTEMFLSRYERLDDRIRVVYTERDADVATLYNEALTSATGEFVGLLRQEDRLAPDAVVEVVRLLQEHPEADLVYTDEDRQDEAGNGSEPFFKPGWSPDLLLSGNYVSHFSVYRRDLLQEVGGFREGFDGCEDYDLVLRVTELTNRVHHVPRVLYHRRAAPATLEEDDRLEARTVRALSEALRRRGLESSVADGLIAGTFRAKLEIVGEPRVSIIIPTRDNVSLLKNCVESVERLTAYHNYEIIIIDNASVDPATVRYLASTPHRVVPFGETFNYSKINNLGVSEAEGEYVLLLNDDTEVISGGWLEAMLEHAQRPEVGAVGAKLIYPDGRIQHAGVLTGVGGSWSPGVATHSHQYYPSDSPGYMGLVARVANYGAVTAACMLVRKSVFEEVGGLDEVNLKVAFNDVDLCLRMRERGYAIVYTPYAELYHHESVSRGYKADPTEALYMRQRWGRELDRDPFYNPHFSRGSGDFNLRADLLRPMTLRSVAGPEDPEQSPLEMNPEALLSYIEARQRVARDSGRTAIVPASGSKGVQAPPKGNLASREPGPTSARQDERSAGSRADRVASEAGRHIRTEQLIWMFGSPRTGSTWLSKMMAELENQERWHEPYVGLLFGSFLYERLADNDKLRNNPSFIMGAPYRQVWLTSIRNFLLDGAEARYPRLRSDQYLVVKEPNGSLGAPLLMEATPESHLIFLIRDPRDVVASRLDAFKEGSWSAQDRDFGTAEKLSSFTRHLAEEYLKVVSQVQEAYEAHPGKKAIVRYEDLRKDTAGTLGGMYATLGIEVDQSRLEAAVAKHSWERIPESDKGSGKFYRKAQPGSWREDLSRDQIRMVEDVTGPVLRRFY